MPFPKANVVDILRSSQRDTLAVQQFEDAIQNVFKISRGNNANNAVFLLKKNASIISNVWYYLLTSSSNLQTLGEEYTGLIRVTEDENLPSKWAQLVWLLLYTGGDPVSEYILKCSKDAITNSTTLQPNAKLLLLRIVEFCTVNKDIVKKLHHSLFYVRGKYYNISNRTMGIKYVLLRHWMQNDAFSEWFKILGHFSLFYILYESVQALWQQNTNTKECQLPTNLPSSNKTCTLCYESRKNPCCTPCGHIYCWSCIYDSLAYQKCCPLCREPLNSSRLVLLQNYI